MPSADDVIKELRVPRGICVLVGEVPDPTVRELTARTELTIYWQLADADRVQRVREQAARAGLYGTRVYVGEGPYGQLHLADNVADALIAGGGADRSPQEELLRVVHPGGKVFVRGRVLTKPFPEGMDDWSHPYHGPDNNPQSNDRLARGPYLTQFLADPRYGPLPQVAVASAGRIFKAFGHIAFKEREEPWLNTLAAFNGYNGALLWRQPISPGIMIHRNTLIATPDRVYFADDKSCKVYDALTGQLLNELVPPAEIAGGTFWKWMALQDGVLYALIGEQEQRDPVIRMRRKAHGWPWAPLSPGYNQEQYPWGFGRNILALDVRTGEVRWHYHEQEPIDSRSLCLSGHRLFGMRIGSYVFCLDTRTGRPLWRHSREHHPEIIEAIGPYLNRQDWRTTWRSMAYAKCNAHALYLAGPQISKLIALAAEDGHVLWDHPYSNYEIVLEGQYLYGLSGQIDKEPSRKFDALTGKVLAEIPLGRRACTRPTGGVDAIFCRANGGSTRLDLSRDTPQLISPMRAQCQDGVTIANGLLYWWPSVCDCNLTLYGITCLGPAGDFVFDAPATEAERLRTVGPAEKVKPLEVTEADWPVYRGNTRANATCATELPGKGRLLWKAQLPRGVTPTAPTAAGDLVFAGASDGIVRAWDGASGQLRWQAFTGGAIRFPPTIWEGRAYVGAGDGWVYAFEAVTGRLLWKFQAAPTERRIPVYGQLLSTWPAASGVLVADGTAYVAAGIVNYDGTHVYALDARTGRIRWQNHRSGHLDPDSRTGVSVQGHMILLGDRLYLAGGNAVSPAVYDARTGRCLNDPSILKRRVNNNVPATFAPRGSELYVIGDRVYVSDKPLYAHPKYQVYDGSVLNKLWVAPVGDRDVTCLNDALLQCFRREKPEQVAVYQAAWGKRRIPNLQPTWESRCPDTRAVAAARNTVAVATTQDVRVFALADGALRWQRKLPSAPLRWGMALTRHGRVAVSLENGQVLVFGAEDSVAMR